MMSIAKQTGGLCLLLALSLSLFACDSGDDSSSSNATAATELELIGTWTNNYDGTETITEES